MTPQPTSITFKEDLTVKHDKPQPTNLSQEDKRLNQLCQSHKILDPKGFFTPLK